MKGINIEEISSMNIEELDNAIDYLMREKKNLEIFKREEALNKLRKAWDEAISLGVDICDDEGRSLSSFDNCFDYYY